MRYFIIAGETSGDLHGSGLMRELAILDEHAEFMGMGGDRMVNQGLDALVHIDKMNFMGFGETVCCCIFTYLPTCLPHLGRIPKFPVPEFQNTLPSPSRCNIHTTSNIFFCPQVWKARLPLGRSPLDRRNQSGCGTNSWPVRTASRTRSTKSGT